MNTRTKVIKQLVRESQYMIDPHAVAEAIVVRSLARRLLPDAPFRGAAKVPEVRSFRPHGAARSFRLKPPGAPCAASGGRRAGRLARPLSMQNPTAVART